MDTRNQIVPSAIELETRFAFSGRLGDLLKEHFIADASNWHLSPKFQLYYRLRRWIPLVLRQRMQQNRNRSLPVGDAWYCQHDFLQAWQRALEAELRDDPAPIIHPWPSGHSHAAIVTHDIESREGVARVDRLARIEEQLGFRSAWYFVPAKYKIDAGLLDDLRARGHEVGVHGYNHDGQLFSSRSAFQRRVPLINNVARQWQATGFRSPMMHRQLQWMQELDFDYDTSCFDIDPFQAMPGGVGGGWPFIVGRLVELPCTLPQDHTLFVTLEQDSTDIWRHKIELLRRLRGMIMCIIHPDYLTSPRHWDRHRELLEMLLEAHDAWRCLPQQVAAWWRKRDQSHVLGSTNRSVPNSATTSASTSAAASASSSATIVGPAAELGRIVSLAELFHP